MKFEEEKKIKETWPDKSKSDKSILEEPRPEGKEDPLVMTSSTEPVKISDDIEIFTDLTTDLTMGCPLF